MLYVFPWVILFLCFSVLLVLRLPRLGKRELILVLFVRLFGLCLFRFVGFLFLLGSGKGCGLWLWYSLDFSLTCFVTYRLQSAALWIPLTEYRLWSSKNLMAPPKSRNTCVLIISQEEYQRENYRENTSLGLDTNNLPIFLLNTRTENECYSMCYCYRWKPSNDQWRCRGSNAGHPRDRPTLYHMAGYKSHLVPQSNTSWSYTYDPFYIFPLYFDSSPNLS